MFSIRRPIDTNRAVRASLTDLLKIIERPKVNLTLQVAEASDKAELREGADTNSVPVAFAEFKQGIAVLVIEGSDGGLVTGDNDEAFGINPRDVINHVLEDGHVLSVSSTEDLHVLQHVLTIVA